MMAIKSPSDGLTMMIPDPYSLRIKISKLPSNPNQTHM
jgi:hypothetical protein